MQEPTSWIGVVGIFVAVVLPLWLNKRYDAKLVALQQQLTDCQQNHTKCEEQHQETIKRVSALEAASKVVAAVQKP